MKQNFRISNFKVKVSAADSWHQPDSRNEIDKIKLTSNHRYDVAECSTEKLDPNNDNETSTNGTINLLDLNDDCLTEIFTYLNVIDLCTVDRLNERSHRVAQGIFHKRYTVMDLTYESKALIYFELTLHKIRNLLKCFGHQIVELKVAALAFKMEYRSRVLDLITRYCMNLKLFECTEFTFNESICLYTQKFFSNLEVLSLNRCEFNVKMKRIFDYCKSLKTLKIQGDNNSNGSCLTIHIPKLESIVLVLNTDLSSLHLYAFFRLNPQLKSVEILNCGYVYDDIFEEIAMNLNNLELLTIEVNNFVNFVENLKALLRLNRLKELKLNCSLYSISSFVDELATKDTIEVLHISDGVLNDHLIDALSKCKRLRSLKLCSMPNVHDHFLSALATNLPILTDFHLSKCQTMTCKGMIAFVEMAENLNTLNITNSIIAIDNVFVLELVRIYKNRNHKLILNLSQMKAPLLPAFIDEQSKFVNIVQANNVMENDIDDDDDYDYFDSDNDFDYDSDYSLNSGKMEY